MIFNMVSQLLNLQSRTGAEALLFITRSTTDTNFRSISFATEGVEGFLTQVYKLDIQDFIGKLEGYAVQGIGGKCAVYEDCQRLTNLGHRGCQEFETARVGTAQ
jgi:hypothetical protein